MFTEQDLKMLEAKNISREQANWQMEQFQNGVAPIKLKSAATLERGIRKIENIDDYIALYKNAHVHVVKFVPASGAASRMFKSLFEFQDVLQTDPQAGLEDYPHPQKFFNNIKKFAFYHELNSHFSSSENVERLINGKKYETILSKLLLSNGLSYASLPKGLLSFHFYAGGVARTPFEEHLYEGTKYAKSTDGIVSLHFTVSPEHLSDFEALKEKATKKYKEMYNVEFNIDFSIQKTSTDTIAVTPENEPFYTSDNELLFRPGGHGALIENLNEIDADIIFIKNIDNVVPEKRQSTTIKYKQALAGTLIDTQKEVFGIIHKLFDSPSENCIREAEELLEKTFLQNGNCLSENDRNGDDKVEQLIDKLNRPIRICGVVKNVGEPGGGPFLVEDKNGCITPQIVESSQVDLKDQNQKKIFSQSTHFNPVDLVCSVRDYKGDKFNLSNYIDNETCFISDKSFDGKELKALELPGLWNGAMAKWNTIFVEVPEDTFNPVKTVNDLLRDTHQ